MKTRTIVIMAVMTALSIVLSRFLAFYLTETMRVGFGAIPIIIAGIWLGAGYGGVVGGAADIIGATVFSGLGIYLPITVGPILVGVTAGLMARFFLGDGKLWRIALIVAAAELIGSILWTGFALSMMTGTSYLIIMAGRLPVNLGVIVVETLVIYVLHRRLGAHFCMRNRKAA